MLNRGLWPALNFGTTLRAAKALTFALKKLWNRSIAAWMTSHLDKMPLTIRGAGPEHLPALMRLQLTTAPSLQVFFSLRTGIPAPSS